MFIIFHFVTSLLNFFSYLTLNHWWLLSFFAHMDDLQYQYFHWCQCVLVSLHLSAQTGWGFLFKTPGSSSGFLHEAWCQSSQVCKTVININALWRDTFQGVSSCIWFCRRLSPERLTEVLCNCHQTHHHVRTKEERVWEYHCKHQQKKKWIRFRSDWIWFDPVTYYKWFLE